MAPLNTPHPTFPPRVLNEVLEESKRDLVYPKRINPITTGPGMPRSIDPKADPSSSPWRELSGCDPPAVNRESGRRTYRFAAAMQSESVELATQKGMTQSKKSSS